MERMADWEIAFRRRKPPTAAFLGRLFFCVVANGARYNAGRYQGQYIIVPPSNDQVFEREDTDDDRERTERLGEIVETYRQLGPEGTSFRVHLDFVETDSPLPFDLGIEPLGDAEHEVTLSVERSDIGESEWFLPFVDLCTTLFDRLDVAWGRQRSEYDPLYRRAMALYRRVSLVNFYSAEMVEILGRERVLSAPALRATELNGGKVALVVCDDPWERGDELDEFEAVNRHLGFR